jgi:hypothetical protein
LARKSTGGKLHRKDLFVESGSSDDAISFASSSKLPTRAPAHAPAPVPKAVRSKPKNTGSKQPKKKVLNTWKLENVNTVVKYKQTFTSTGSRSTRLQNDTLDVEVPAEVISLNQNDDPFNVDPIEASFIANWERYGLDLYNELIGRSDVNQASSILSCILASGWALLL